MARRGLALAFLVGILVGSGAEAHPRARKKDPGAVGGEVLRFRTERAGRDVRDLVVDPNGVAWALDGTGSFLIRPPGKASEWKEIRPGTDGLPEVHMHRLEIWAGGVWIATHFSGLVAHAAGSWVTRTTREGLSSDRIKDLVVHQGALWAAGAEGLDRLELGSARARQQVLPDGLEGKPTALASGPDGLLLGTSRGEVLAWDGTAWRRLAPAGALAGRPITRMVVQGGILWVGTLGGLFRIDPATGKVEPLEGEDAELAGISVADLLVRKGELWVGTLGAGILRRGPAGWVQYVPPYSALPSDQIHGLALAEDGSTVLAATGRGVGLIDVSIDPVAAIDVAVRIGKTDVPAETDISRPDPAPRTFFASERAGGQLSPLAALGDMLFEDPTILGEKAQRMGISCGSCHPGGSVNTNLFIQGISHRRGGVDLSNKHFAAGAENGVDDPVDTPSLRGLRFTAPFGRQQQEGGIREFTRRVIVLEFDGPEPSPKVLDALVAYQREFDFLPTRWVGDDGTLSRQAPEPVRRGEALFRKEFPTLPMGSCAACHVPASFFLDTRMHDIGTGGAFDTPTLRNANYSPPYMHDGRFKNYAEVIAHFDRTYGLGLKPAEKKDLEAYLEAVGEGIDPYDK